MSPTQPGRKEPDRPELQGACLLISVPCKKSWAKTPSYWLEIYGKHGPDHVKFVRFYIYRQWSFMKGSMFEGKRELVEGGYLSPKTYVSFGQTVEDAVDTCGILVRDKGYDVCPVDVTAAGMFAIGGPEKLEIVAAGFETHVRVPKDQESQVNVQLFHSRSKKEEEFWDTANRRAKKAKW